LPDISGDVTITNSTGSSNLTVRRDTEEFYRIFKVNSGVSATFDGFTIANGRTLEDGGGIYNDGGTVNVTNGFTIASSATSGDGGGIYNNGGTVNVTNGTFSSNLTFFSGGKGGGISNNSGTVNVTNGTFSSNGAFSGGGISNNGPGSVKIANSTFYGNYGVRFTSGFSGAVNGAAIFNIGGTVEVTNSTLFRNGAGGGSGGGIYNGEGGTVKVTNSNISENTVGGFFDRGTWGGGIYNDNGTVEVTNSTLSGNEIFSKGGRGTGIYNKAGTVTLTNSTISGNKANPDTYNSFPSILPDPISSGAIWNGGTLNVKNTIVAQNTAATNPDVSGSFASGGYNLIGNGTGSTGFTAVGDLVGTAAAPIDPLLNPLADNGGPTQTVALQPGSPAINGGDPAFVLTSGPFIGPP
ncbi:choice-of-anchor Q domain-containing protein, partial [Microcoleus sp. B3-A4]|uniref:choice-of-anchor Q domain-containing protein n=1 Tax=Microcoleus sp. B3-A4 TaxID=2818653 RepID=UPI002FD10C76